MDDAAAIQHDMKERQVILDFFTRNGTCGLIAFDAVAELGLQSWNSAKMCQFNCCHSRKIKKGAFRQSVTICVRD